MSSAELQEPGLCVAHLFWKTGDKTDFGSLQEYLGDLDRESLSVVTVKMLGHRSDICVLGLAREPARLRELQSTLRTCGLELSYSYVSVTEVSEYARGVPDELKQARLYPNLPPEGKPAFCFYPMSKRRSDSWNWYGLDYEQREKLMMGHGKVGRQFAGRVIQLVTASTGLDDFEWGVSLFGTSMQALKDCVYSMRFDPASAQYAEFGPFLSGIVCEPSDLGEMSRI